jgi:hypothetical protein
VCISAVYACIKKPHNAQEKCNEILSGQMAVIKVCILMLHTYTHIYNRSLMYVAYMHAFKHVYFTAQAERDELSAEIVNLREQLAEATSAAEGSIDPSEYAGATSRRAKRRSSGPHEEDSFDPSEYYGGANNKGDGMYVCVCVRAYIRDWE